MAGKDKKPRRQPRGPRPPKVKGTNKPGRPPGPAPGMPTTMDKVIYLKMTDPAMSNARIATMLGINQTEVERQLRSPEAKKRLGRVLEKVADKIADKHAELVESALLALPDCINAVKVQNIDLGVKLEACKFILKSVFEKLGREAGADEITFEVLVQEDGTIAQRITKKRGGEEV